jgi:DTW domain-containing protein YfiP
VLQHPRAARHPLGTVPYLRTSLERVTVCTGVDFASDAAAERARNAVLVFPADADDAGREPVRPHGALTLVVVDGTWPQARSIVRASPWLRALPRLSLTPRQPSAYGILRRQPHAGCLSTLEAVAEALLVLDGDEGAREALLRPLHALVGLQMACRRADYSYDQRSDRARLEQAGYLPALP